MNFGVVVVAAIEEIEILFAYIHDAFFFYLSLSLPPVSLQCRDGVCFVFRRTFFQQTRPTLLGSCNCDELKPIQCHLETKDLWEKFHELGTEMIITKTGRCVLQLLSDIINIFLYPVVVVVVVV